MNYVVIKDGVPVYGPGDDEKYLKKMALKCGGELKRQVDIRPAITPRMQVYGKYDVVIGPERVEYVYSVLDIPTDTVRENLFDATKKEAEKRALGIAPYWKQINAITDPDPDTTAKIKAVRDASDQLEDDIKAMDRAALAAVNIAGWSGWPEGTQTVN
jgi:hypothetical protein